MTFADELADVVTSSRIAQLMRDAAEHGDLSQVALCMIALNRITVDPDSDSDLAKAVENMLPIWTQQQAWDECIDAIERSDAMLD